ncbi:hypothetical protein IG5_00203 [Bacillus toyonensis]|uniref:hypothetical protein n=1 Tax=Bacillus toyonensis TaxID=155322 RepID=UPI00032DF4B8|nr:hypothetical protein [Bacillus toyonensis]EOP30584.1 hypothetical protein IG5_00203 [Bacillus toyonensis]
MEKYYEILVVDDEKNVRDIFDVFIDEFKAEDINVKFEYIHDLEKFDEVSQPFDIIVFDSEFRTSNLSTPIEKRSQGFELIRKYRKINKRTKVIFYSSAFDLKNEDQIPLSHKDYFEIINELNIFRLVYKNKADQVYDAVGEAIKAALDDLDVVMTSLEKMYYEYKGIDIDYEIEGENIPLEQLMYEFKMGGEHAEKFRKDIVEMMLSYMSNFEL